MGSGVLGCLGPCPGRQANLGVGSLFRAPLLSRVSISCTQGRVDSTRCPVGWAALAWSPRLTLSSLAPVHVQLQGPVRLLGR